MRSRALTAATLRLLARTGPSGTGQAIRTSRRLPEHWHQGQVVRTRVGGFSLELELGDNAQRELYYLGAYERPFVRFLTHELCSGDVVLDAGAHVGIFALPLARRLSQLGAGRLIAVEASPSTAARLRRHVHNNHLADWVDIVQIALAERFGEIALRSDVQFGTQDRAVRSRYGTGPVTEVVNGIPFDDWVDEHPLSRLDLVKFDIEGSELAALHGMHRTLTRLRPRLVTVECKDYILDRANTTQTSVDEFMTNMGYERQQPLSRLIKARGGLSHIDDNILYRPRR